MSPSTLVRWFNTKFESTLCVTSLVVMSCCVFLQVILRYLFHQSAPWAEELAIYGMAFSVYFGAALAVTEKSHVRILNLVQLFPRKIAIGIIVSGDAVWCAFNIFMVFHGIDYMRILWDTHFISPAMGIEQRWPQAIVPFCFALMTFRILQFYYRWFRTGICELTCDLPGEEDHAQPIA